MNTYNMALKGLEEYKKWRGFRRNFALDDGEILKEGYLRWNHSLKDCFNAAKLFDAGRVDPNIYSPLKIIVNGPATIVFWEDGTKTVVKCAKGENWDIYNAFTAALAIKVFGSNSKIKKILKTKVEWPDDFSLAVKEE